LSWALIPIYIAIGALVGFLAGLLGIGGGMTMIPLLTLILTHERFPPEHVLHIAAATSMAARVCGADVVDFCLLFLESSDVLTRLALRGFVRECYSE
jgi:hypothetical protein